MRISVSVLASVAASVVSSAALAWLFHGLTPLIAWMALALGVAVGAAAWRAIPPEPVRALRLWDYLLFGAFALASLRAFLWLISQTGDDIRVLSPNNLGDLSKHIHFIRYMAHGPAFWPEAPYFPGKPLTYYLGTDLFNSLLLLAGLPLEKGLILAGLAGSALTAWALWRWGGPFALAMLLFNGGLAGFLLFRTGTIEDFQAELAWKNLFLSMFVTQRGLLYALPATFLLLTSWRERYFRSGRPLPLWIEYLLYATMAIFSLHAFAFLCLILTGIFATVPAARGALIRFVVAAVPPATALVLGVTGMFTQEAGATWHPGWMQDSASWFAALEAMHLPHPPGPVANTLLFWGINFGIALPLLVLLAAKTIRKADPEAACFTWSALVVFLACCLFRFAAWDWDNTKFFLWAWLTLAPGLWQMITVWPRWVRSVVCLLLFFSGAVSLVGGLDARHGYRLASRREMAETEMALKDVPVLDRIATDPSYNNPVMLLGRPVVCGYDGMLWAHGIDYVPTLETLKAVLAGRAGDADARRIGAEWIYLPGRPPRRVE